PGRRAREHPVRRLRMTTGSAGASAPALRPAGAAAPARRGGRTRATAVALASLLLLSACGPSAPPSRTVEFSGPAMGTTWSVKIVAPADGLSTDESRAIDQGIRDELVRINQLLSTWDPESELSRF